MADKSLREYVASALAIVRAERGDEFTATVKEIAEHIPEDHRPEDLHNIAYHLKQLAKGGEFEQINQGPGPGKGMLYRFGNGAARARSRAKGTSASAAPANSQPEPAQTPSADVDEVVEGTAARIRMYHERYLAEIAEKEERYARLGQEIKDDKAFLASILTETAEKVTAAAEAKGKGNAPLTVAS